jgi:O-methyltransferase
MGGLPGHRSKRLRYALSYPRLKAVWRRNRDATLVNRRSYIGNLHLVATTLDNPALDGGAIVECGTWKGGMACGMLAVAPGARDYHFFDSFEGLPPVEPIDGAWAQNWQQDTKSERYHDNVRADRGEFEARVRAVARPDQRLFVHQGWFSETLPEAPEDLKIAVLRLDGDLYQSTLDCLEHLFDKLLPGGIVIIDDYHDWDGCTRAVHDFLSARKAAEAIRESRFGGVFHIVKRAPDTVTA